MSIGQFSCGQGVRACSLVVILLAARRVKGGIKRERKKSYNRMGVMSCQDFLKHELEVIMKKKVIAIMVCITILCLVPSVTFAMDNRNAVFAGGDEAVEYADSILQQSIPGVGNRHIPIEWRTTGQYSNFVRDFFGTSIGTLTSSGFFVLNGQNLQSFGFQSINAVRGPAAFPHSHVNVQQFNRRPIPSVGWSTVEATFITFAAAHTLSHCFHFYTSGQYAFRPNNW